MEHRMATSKASRTFLNVLLLLQPQIGNFYLISLQFSLPLSGNITFSKFIHVGNSLDQHSLEYRNKGLRKCRLAEVCHRS